MQYLNSLPLLMLLMVAIRSVSAFAPVAMPRALAVPRPAAVSAALWHSLDSMFAAGAPARRQYEDVGAVCRPHKPGCDCSTCARHVVGARRARRGRRA